MKNCIGIQSVSTTINILGFDIYYETYGQGFPLLLIHANLLDSRMWDTQFIQLSQHFRIIRYDLPGMGKSTKPQSTYSDLEIIAGLMDALHISCANFVGLGLGSVVAIEYALAYPERVGRMVLASPFLFGYRVPPEVAVSDPVAQEIRAARKNEALPEMVTDLWLSHPINASVKANPHAYAKVERMIRDNVESWMHILAQDLFSWPDSPIYERVSGIAQPSLVLYGEADDANAHARAQATAAAIGTSQLLSIQSAGHLINLEQPEVFNQTVLDFLIDGSPHYS